MKPERYKRVDQVFQQALSQPPENLESFLKEACAGDEALRREVESLIEVDRQGGSFLDSPVPGSMLLCQTEEPHPNFLGRTLLHYRCVSP